MFKKMKPPKTIRVETKAKDGSALVYFRVMWRDLSGKRQAKQFSDKQSASMHSSMIHTALMNDGASRQVLSTTLAESQLRQAEQAIDRLGGKYALSDCVDFFLKHFRDPSFKITLSDASAQFLAAQAGRIRPASMGEFKRTLRAFVVRVGDLDVHAVNHDVVAGYLKSLTGKEPGTLAAPKTVANNRKSLMRFFNWCVEKPQKFIEVNPVADIKAPKIDKGEVRTLSNQTVVDLMKYVEIFKGGSLVRYFALAIFAGIRPHGELDRLDGNGSRIDLKNGVIKLTAADSKTRRARQIDIQPNLAAWLARFPGEIFPTGCDRDITAIREQFGFSGDDTKNRDIMRHTFISNHVQAFDSFAQAALQAGNSESIIRRDYLNVTTKDEAVAFWQILPA
jgi:integrase